jgi:protein-S-isoprenylcysteine O-methyltransferase Ste14
MFSSGTLRALQNSRAYDWAMRLPAALYSFYALGHDVTDFYHDAQNDPGAWVHADVGVIIACLARISQWMFIALLGTLPLIRHRPIAKSDSWLPRLAALITVLIPPLCLSLPRAAPNLACNLVAVLLGLTASVLAVMTLQFLGRSFSVMPEARRLVMSGPYAIVRHPLYLFELLGVVGILLQVRSPAGVGLFFLIAALQVARARWEEGVLARAIPDYEAYRGRVPFLLPRDPRSLFALLRDDPAVRRRCGLVMGSAFGLLAVVLVALPRLTG